MTVEKPSELGRLQAENADLRQFAYTVAHDLQSPLKQIGSFSDLVESSLKKGDAPRAAEYLERIRLSAERMSGVIAGLLDFSQATAGGSETAPVDLNLVLSDVLHDLGDRILSLRAGVSVGALPTVDARRPHMYQLFLNLIDNALKYAGATLPAIDIGAAVSPEGWKIWVSDNGIGVDSTDVRSIFELFKRSSRGADRGGRGIGLTICKRIIEAHGGRIWVESNPHRGSCFFFTLPARKI